MPELPDLQVFSHNLDKRLKGKTVKTVLLQENKKGTSPAEMKKALEGHKIKQVFREGKELRFEFDNGNLLGLHLMLNGELKIFDNKNAPPNPILELLFDDDTGFVMTDYRGLANATLNPEKSNAPDAMASSVNFAFLKEQFQKKRTQVKAWLLDQKNIRGIGNAYADEILWEARISPFSICNKIPDNKLKDLAYCIKSTLKNAEQQILKSHPDIISGEIRDFMLIHNPRKKTSPTGVPILTETAGARKTYYTEEQEEYK